MNAVRARGREEDHAELQIRSDSSFLIRARRGDQEALGALLDQERDRVVSLCYRLLGDRTDAEDAAQDAMLKVSLHLGELVKDERFASWCWRIAHRICMDRLRNGRRRERVTVEKSTPAMVDAEQRIVERIAVTHILAAMPEDMSEVLILREMEGQTYDDIATRLVLPLGTVKSRLSAARERFRRDYMAVIKDDTQ